MFYQISLICRGFIIINVKLMYPSLRNKHFFTKKRQERIYWVNIIILLFITKTADNPSFPLLLALWSDGFCNKSHNKKFQHTDYLGKNMRKITQVISAVCLLFALNSSAVALASSPSPLNPGTNVARIAEQAPIHWVSVAQIENSLAGRPPMAVGFDIDDTVLFSSPGFWRGKKTFSPESEDYLKNPVFWEKMNNGWDEFSIPKEVARQLIDMHVRRGDAIFFVTGRSPTKTETVSKTLADNFHIPATNMNPVIFAGDKPGQNTKSQWLQDKNIRIFYGDSDNDITAARDVGARGIRILRASNSTYKPLPQAGAFGEEVIVNSEY